MIVADASWLIALRDDTDALHAASLAVLDQAGDTPVLLHPLTLAECLVAPARLGLLDEAEAAIRDAVDVVDFDPVSPARLAAIRAQHELRLPDAIVLDTAIHYGASAVATFDDRLATVAKSVGLAVLDGSST